MKSDEQVLGELKRAVAGLWFMSESDYPFEVFRWDGSIEVGPQFLREASGQGPDAPVQSLTLEEFFGGETSVRTWRAGAESGAPEPDPSLPRTLKENLRDPRVFKVGSINIPVFVVGLSGEGNWIGVSTRVVET